MKMSRAWMVILGFLYFALPGGILPDSLSDSFLMAAEENVRVLPVEEMSGELPEESPDADVAAPEAGMTFIGPEKIDADLWREYVASGGDLNAHEGGQSVAQRALRQFPFRTAFWRFMLENGADPNITDTQDRPLVARAAREDYALTKLCLEKGADVNAVSPRGVSALTESLYGRAEILELVLSAGADVKAKTLGGMPVLSLVMANNTDVLKKTEMLLKAGADVNAENRSGETPLLCALNISDARIAALLVEAGADVNGTGTQGITPLMKAVKMGDLNLTRLMLQKGADVKAQGRGEETVLFDAVRFRDFELCRLLVEHEMDVNRVSQGMVTAIFEAVRLNDTRIARFLLEHGAYAYREQEKADGSATRNVNRLIFNQAVLNGNLELAKLLVKHGAPFLDVRQSGKSGEILQTPLLMQAVSSGDVDVCRYVLTFNPEVDVRGQDNQTPLHAAAQRHNLDVCIFLLSHGADVNAKNSAGKTPLMLMSRNSGGESLAGVSGWERCMVRVGELLLDAGADEGLRDNNSRDVFSDGDSLKGAFFMKFLRLRTGRWDDEAKRPQPIFMAAYTGDIPQMEARIKAGELLRVADSDGETPLHYAVRGNQVEMCRFLLKNGASMTAEAGRCWNGTPLHFAAGLGRVEILRLFLDNGANVNLRVTTYRQTPLHWAVIGLQGACVTELVKRGAQANLTDEFHRSVFACAMIFGKESYCKYFCENGLSSAEILSKSIYGNILAPPRNRQPNAVLRQVDILLECGLDINTGDMEGNTLLHFFAATQELGVIPDVIARGADVSRKNKKGQTPADVVPPQAGRSAEWRRVRAVFLGTDEVSDALNER